MLALTGLDEAETVGLRGVAAGQLRPHRARRHFKARVSGRAWFAAHFVEDRPDEIVGNSTFAPRA